MPLTNPIDDKPALVEVMTLCHLAQFFTQIYGGIWHLGATMS